MRVRDFRGDDTELEARTGGGRAEGSETSLIREVVEEAAAEGKKIEMLLDHPLDKERMQRFRTKISTIGNKAGFNVRTWKIRGKSDAIVISATPKLEFDEQDSRENESVMVPAFSAPIPQAPRGRGRPRRTTPK